MGRAPPRGRQGRPLCAAAPLSTAVCLEGFLSPRKPMPPTGETEAPQSRSIILGRRQGYCGPCPWGSAGWLIRVWSPRAILVVSASSHSPGRLVPRCPSRLPSSPPPPPPPCTRRGAEVSTLFPPGPPALSTQSCAAGMSHSLPGSSLSRRQHLQMQPGVNHSCVLVKVTTFAVIKTAIRSLGKFHLGVEGSRVLG